MKKCRMTKWPVLFQVSCCNGCQVVVVSQELDVSQGQNPSPAQLLLWENHLTLQWQSTGFTLLTIDLPRVSNFAVFLLHILLTQNRAFLWASVLLRNKNNISTDIYWKSSHLRGVHICSLETSSDEGPRNEYKYCQRSPATKGI